MFAFSLPWRESGHVTSFSDVVSATERRMSSGAQEEEKVSYNGAMSDTYEVHESASLLSDTEPIAERDFVCR